MNRARLALLLLLLALLLAGLWTYRNVANSLREIRAANLTTLLNTQIEVLDLWIAEQLHDARQWAADPRVRRRLDAVMRIAARGDAAALGDSPERRALLELLLPPEGRAVAAHVIDARGRIVVSRHPGYLGRTVTPETMQQLAPVLRGESRFIPPQHERVRVVEPESVAFDRPLVWVETPVKNAEGDVIAILGLGHIANQAFADVLKIARPGRTGEAYAFDADGIMLSETRYLREAAQRGLLAAGAGDSSILALHVRDPSLGTDPADAARPQARPLTRLAAAAIAARHEPQRAERAGLLLEPYHNYLGEEVIGAWRWLARHDMGVALEMAAAEAYAPLRYLNIGLAAVMVLMALVWLSAFVSLDKLTDRLRGKQAPRSIGPYRLVRTIGEGAISTVYLAHHRLLNRAVAVKVLKPQSTTDEWTARFQREVQLASTLRHPNTIAIYDFGQGPGATLYYAMEFLEGLALSDLVERYGPVPAARAAHLLRQVCASLAEAHDLGLIHRDIKPQNIMVCRVAGQNDVVKVLDFGLVKQLDASDTRDLTSSLRILGTPLYMAPERIREPGKVDARSDLYSLGAVGYYLLTGRRLFETENAHDLTYQILHTPPPRASAHAAVPRELDELLARCLAKDPAGRPASAAEMGEALERILAAHPWTARQIDEWWRLYWVDASHPDRRLVVE
ncbi:MAG: serine/threonine protein kinase [Pseudomonadota bacterium]|jgi:serine/threonine-protein kinase